MYCLARLAVRPFASRGSQIRSDQSRSEKSGSSGAKRSEQSNQSDDHVSGLDQRARGEPMSESQVWIHSGEACDGVPILYSFSRVERSEDCPRLQERRVRAAGRTVRRVGNAARGSRAATRSELRHSGLAQSAEPSANTRDRRRFDPCDQSHGWLPERQKGPAVNRLASACGGSSPPLSTTNYA